MFSELRGLFLSTPISSFPFHSLPPQGTKPKKPVHSVLFLMTAVSLSLTEHETFQQNLKGSWKAEITLSKARRQISFLEFQVPQPPLKVRTLKS
jgi:hypothetical protein